MSSGTASGIFAADEIPGSELVIVAGGRSAEHDVSLVSGAHLWSAAVEGGADVTGIGISRDGVWHHIASDHGPETGAPFAINGPEIGIGALVAAAQRGAVVVPALHGPLGEDGTFQGACEVAGVAYTGAGVLASALCMNKAVAKRFLAGAGIPQTPFVVVNGSDSIDTVRERSQHLGFPLFVKPSSMGSSIGVSKVGDQDALAAAVARAGAYDDCIVIEQAVIGREIEIAVLGRRDTMVSRPGEIHVGAEFYDYHDKYTDDRATASVPADLPAAVAQRVHELALEVTSVLGCREMARCDMFVTEDGAVLLNEVNTIPGFTPISMYPKMLNDVGVSTVHILNRLVADARARHARSQQRSTAHG